MKCWRCGGDVEERTVRFCVCDVSPVIMIQDVPAQVCKRCGEQVFSDSTTKVFEQIRDGKFLARSVLMSIFDFKELTEQTNDHS